MGSQLVQSADVLSDCRDEFAVIVVAFHDLLQSEALDMPEPGSSPLAPTYSLIFLR